MSDSNDNTISDSFYLTVVFSSQPLVKVNSGPPIFDGLDSIAPIDLTLGDVYTLELPKIVDPDGDAYKLTIENFPKVIGFT
jgi:hypothetical protein